MQGQGDVLGSEAYHADLSLEYGIKYVWRGRVTSAIAQGTPHQLSGIAHSRHPFRSGATVGKELVKGILGRLGSRKYHSHTANNLAWPIRLRDGASAVEFLRCNPFWGGVDQETTAPGLGNVITTGMLDRLSSRNGFCVLYTHLGKIARRGTPFPEATRRVFELLRQYQDEKRILVTTTRRILDYKWNTSAVKASIDTEDRVVRLYGTATDPAVLQGLTVYIDEYTVDTFALPDGRRVKGQRNPPDETGRRSLMVPWSRLVWPL